MDDLPRCPWCLGAENYRLYHDQEWGLPRRDDRTQFEFLLLEGAQAGLSWATILNKRAGYRRCFADFDPQKVAAFSAEQQEQLRQDSGIVRNRLKIAAAVNNAQRFLEIAERCGSFGAYLWSFVDNIQVINHWRSLEQIPATTPLSDKISKELKRQGFKFVGSTIIYSHMQATGLVNDHLVSCFRHSQLLA